MSDPLTVRLAPPTEHERMLAMLAHLLGVVGWATGGIVSIVGPLVLYYVKRDDSRFVAFHALQTVFFQLAAIGAGGILAVGSLCIVTLIVTIPGMILLFLGMLAYGVLGCIAGYQGVWSRYPLVGTWALEHVLGPQLDRGTPA